MPNDPHTTSALCVIQNATIYKRRGAQSTIKQGKRQTRVFPHDYFHSVEPGRPHNKASGDAATRGMAAAALTFWKDRPDFSVFGLDAAQQNVG
jgi:hypothetical protein